MRRLSCGLSRSVAWASAVHRRWNGARNSAVVGYPLRFARRRRETPSISRHANGARGSREDRLSALPEAATAGAALGSHALRRNN